MTQNNPDQITIVEFREDSIYLHLADERVIGNPLAWHSWLLDATSEQRANAEMYELSVYWPDLDEGLDVEEMMKGMPPHIARQQKITAP